MFWTQVFLLAAAAVFGFFAPRIAGRIIANYPGTWADVVMGNGKCKMGNGRTMAVAVASMIFTSIILMFAGALSVLMAIALCLFTLAVIIDLKVRLIPDILTFPLILIGAAAAQGLPWIAGGLTEALIAAAVGYILASVMGMVYYKKSDVAIGGGDIKLIAAGGMFLGATGLPVALITAALAAYALKHKYPDKFVPFAPFFAFGALAYLTYWILF
ncbi:MAG: A24 family peptidase [Alphaproteobacteria bacterium]|nr:A24 family peptidase [Alphaproteobacteria bacterium]